MSSISEQVLVERLYARDPKAMGLFYERYGKTLYGVLLRIVHHQELAEDALQECMVKIWYAFPTYDPEKGRLFTWALNICRYAAIDQLRTRRYQETKRTQSLEKSAAAHMLGQATFSPDHIGLRDLLLLLKPRDRVLMNLLYLNDFTQAEAAEELGLPLGTIKTRARAAIQLLAKVVREDRLVFL